MIFSEISIGSCRLRLKKPFVNSSQKFNFRDVRFIKFFDEYGNVGIGECAPLPGFSPENIVEGESFLVKIQAALKGKSFDGDFFSFGEMINSLTELSSVRFAAEQAFMNLLIEKNKFFDKKYFRNYINVNAVIAELSIRDSIKRFQESVDSGFDTIKIKFGVSDFESELSMLRMIKNDFPQINLRLDLNGAWSFEEAKKKLDKLEGFDFEYIEQPVVDAEELLRLSEMFYIPLVPDESLQNPKNLSIFMNHDSIKHLVVKPMFTGGILSTLKIIKEANLKNKKVIISSGLETGVGRSALVWLSIKPDHKLAHGLGTSSIFAKDPNSKLFDARNGTIYFDPNEFPNFRQTPC